MNAKINLLPDVRKAKLKGKQRKQLAVTLATITVVACAGILIVGFLVIQAQNLRVNQLTSSISGKKGQEKSYPDVNTMLSLQARVAALPSLYNGRAYMTTLFNILSSNEPKEDGFTNIAVSQGQLTISAQGRSYYASAKLARALEQASKDNTPYFTNVTLSAVTLSANTTAYSISATLNPGATSGQ